MYGNPMEIVNELRIYTGLGFGNRPQTPVRFSRSGKNEAIAVTVLSPGLINLNSQESLQIIAGFKTVAFERSQADKADRHAI